MANPVVTPGTPIDATALRTAIYNACVDILPTASQTPQGYIYESTSTNLPEPLLASYLSTRAELLSTINTKIQNLSVRPITNNNIVALDTYTWLKEIFIEMGRCKRVNYHNENNTGRTLSPSDLISQGVATPTVAAGVFTYFAPNFTLATNYGAVSAANNGYKDETRYQTLPANTTNWNSNTRMAPNTAKFYAVDINHLIEAVNSMNSQLDAFDAEWQNKMTNPYWWNGDSSDVSNVSNRIFFVRYWCHNNCHSNCHHERTRR